MRSNPRKLPVPSADLAEARKVGSGRRGDPIRYVLPDGTNISRRQYEEDARLGGDTYEAAALRRRLYEVGNIHGRDWKPGRNFDLMVAQYQAAKRSRGERSGKWDTVLRHDSTFWTDLADLDTSGTRPGSKRGRALESFGLRRRGDRSPVGQSPKAPIQVPTSVLNKINAKYPSREEAKAKRRGKRGGRKHSRHS